MNQTTDIPLFEGINAKVILRAEMLSFKILFLFSIFTLFCREKGVRETPLVGGENEDEGGNHEHGDNSPPFPLEKPALKETRSISSSFFR